LNFLTVNFLSYKKAMLREFYEYHLNLKGLL
jgi:hypothetical protein